MKKIFLLLICFNLLLCGCTSFYQLVNISPSSKLKEISFANEAPNSLYEFYYSDTLANDYLAEIRNLYNIDLLVKDKKTDLAKILTILDWTSKQWDHNGSNSPTKQDALTILKEAKEGKQFRCVEYGIVATAALNSVGFNARTLGLKTRDVEKVMRGAGHVVSEVYSKEFGKWIFIDPQFNILPVVNGRPLNAVEFQKEIYNQNIDLKLINLEGELSKEDMQNYFSWVGKYLFYFDVLFDQKTLNSSKFKSINGMTKLTLVPVGYKEPRIFQRNSKIDYSYYTRSLNDFYRQPK